VVVEEVTVDEEVVEKEGHKEGARRR